MKRLTPLTVRLVLAAFVAGGVVAPSLHRLHHLAEAARTRAAHAAHHHHTAADDHGEEWTPPCPSPPAVDDLACVLCQGLSAASWRGTAASLVPALGRRLGSALTRRWGARVPARGLIRGPPEGIA